MEPIIIEDLQHTPPSTVQTQDHQLLDECLLSITNKTAHPVSSTLYMLHAFITILPCFTITL
jgi:hypothetical protein